MITEGNSYYSSAKIGKQKKGKSTALGTVVSRYRHRDPKTNVGRVSTPPMAVSSPLAAVNRTRHHHDTNKRRIFYKDGDQRNGRGTINCGYGSRG